eukprot:249893-Amorphochlora_amoeboformis.AAC.1
MIASPCSLWVSCQKPALFVWLRNEWDWDANPMSTNLPTPPRRMIRFGISPGDCGGRHGRTFSLRGHGRVGWRSGGSILYL